MGQIVNVFKRMNPLKVLIPGFDLILLYRAFGKLGDFCYSSTWGMLPNSNSAAGSALFLELVKRIRNTGDHTVVVSVEKIIQKQYTRMET